MRFVLDTNICIFAIRRKSQRVIRRLQQHQVGDVGISTVSVAELRYGAEKSKNPAKNHIALDTFLISLDVASFDSQAAEHYGKIREDLESRGLPIGSLDTMIAAHALSLGANLVTNNVSEFSRVPGLIIEDWTLP